MVKKMAVALLGVGLLFNSCYNDKEELLYPDGVNCSTIGAQYTANVSPIIQTRCAIGGCHDAGSINGPGELTSYDKIKNAAVKIRSAVVSRLMPQGSSLTTTEIKIISCWVDSGAPNN
jgi:hypothetical protein